MNVCRELSIGFADRFSRSKQEEIPRVAITDVEHTFALRRPNRWKFQVFDDLCL
jgi:hypothetical protein